ncbi:DUF222 domain-containing protein [Terrabacter sp. 2RAF25]|uniref:HNH endonuclease signature motif containing protein n=1 Tax=Terrabacter sp. 2RAF25 TaxID=3232998 RepID=UPI003F9E3A58
MTTVAVLERRAGDAAACGVATGAVGVPGPASDSVPPAAADVLELAALRDLPGLAARLSAMAAELRLIARNTPVWTMPEAGLGDAIEQAQAVREMAHSLSAVLAAEVSSRGLPEAAGLSRNDWIAGHAPGLADGASAALTAVGAAMNDPRWTGLVGRVRDGSVSVDQAAVIVRFRGDVITFADPVQVEQVVDAMVEAAPQLGVRELRRLAAHGRASLRPPEQVDDEAQRLRAARSLTKVGRCAGMTEYLWRLDPEGSAILDAAVDALARPRPDLDWTGWPSRPPGSENGAGARAGAGAGPGPGAGAGARSDADVGAGADADARRSVDPRSPATRRADAALELIQRAVAAPQGVTRTPRTKLVVTMSLDALLDRLRGAGLADNDEVLSASTVRRVACEAEILPTVLGGPSQVLDIGRTDRYFTPAQRLALAQRDHGCSYPGCTVPPQWCEAHHVVHWLHGGATDLCNGALLCGRHHTIVHQLGLTATVLPDQAIWHVPEEHRRC